MARYEPILVTRTPAQSTSPTLTEIDEFIIKERLSYSQELLGGGAINFAIDPDEQSQDIKDILIDIADNPCEVWLYRDGSIVQAGPIIGVQMQSGTINIVTRSLLYYLRYMFVTSDLVYSSIDQYTIAKGLVDHWQSKDYGNYGIDTSGIGTSGQTRSYTYRAEERPNVLRKIEQMADNLNGFEFYVDPSTRDLELTDRRGSDKSASVVIDGRGIVTQGAYFSVAQGDYANEVYAIGADYEDSSPAVGTETNTAARNAWGLAGLVISVDGVTQQGTLEDYAQTALDAVEAMQFQPTGSQQLIPVQGAGIDDFDVGDTVTYEFDFGFGLVALTRDIWQKHVSVDKSGQEFISVEFLNG